MEYSSEGIALSPFEARSALSSPLDLISSCLKEESRVRVKGKRRVRVNKGRRDMILVMSAEE